MILAPLLLVSNNPIITESVLAPAVYKSLLALLVFGTDDVGTFAIVFRINSVAIITPYNATAIAMAKASVAPELLVVAHSGAVAPEFIVNTCPAVPLANLVKVVPVL